MRDKLIKDESLLDLFNKQDFLEGELHDIEREIDKKINDLGLVLGDELCLDRENPYNTCMYYKDDLYRDCCVFCGEPEERK